MKQLCVRGLFLAVPLLLHSSQAAFADTWSSRGDIGDSSLTPALSLEGGASFETETGFHPARVLVRFKADAGPSQVAAAHAAAGAVRTIRTYAAVSGLQLVEVPPGQVLSARAAYAAHAAVAYAEPDYEVQAVNTPDDTSFGELWGLHNTGQTVNGDPGTADADIDAPEAWDIWTGDPGFRIAVIDTGVNYNHPDLAANIWTNPGEIPENEIDDDGNGYVDDIHGYDARNDDGDPNDDHSHGSHVSGTIGGVGDNGEGVAGVNWQCQIVGLKFIGAGGSGSISDAIETMQYAIDNDIKISNNSWGGGGFSQGMFDIIQASQAIGHIFVAAAGNSNNNNDVNPFYPASYDLPNIIAVAATNNDDGKAGFSSYGATTVDLGAPGVNVFSTVLGVDYAYFNGTSMATPHVSGVAALMMSRFPGLSPAQVKGRVLATARPVAALEGITLTGGVVNAFEAIGADCNTNLALDADEVAGGSSMDCDANGVPDECQLGSSDCNTNGMVDACDIADGSSDDCDLDGVPTECDAIVADCNTNSADDACDINSALSADCNADGVPDECNVAEQDCNTNGQPDACDTTSGASPDCSLNGVPDECEPDCNSNGSADSCDTSGGSVAVDNCADALEIGPGVVYLGSTAGATNDGSANCGSSGSSPDLWYKYTPDSSGTLTASLCGSTYDSVLSVHSDCPGTGANQLACDDDFCGGGSGSQVTLPVHAGSSYWIRVTGFAGETGDFQLLLTGPGSLDGDCNANAVPDACEDCDTNGQADECDTGGLVGTYFDNIDFTGPSETRTDPVVQFVWGFGSPIPGVIDSETFSVRWEGFVVPEFAETYTFYTRTDDGVRLFVNGELLIDMLVDQGPTEWSGVIDLEAGEPVAVLMEYYENSGAATAELRWSSASTPKAIIPLARLRTGQGDCDLNGQPDACDPDCNTNGVSDACDIADGNSTDSDGDGVPDECAACASTSGDVNGDAAVDGDDIKAFVECLLTGETVAGDCVCADLDGNAVVNEADAELFVGLLLGL